MIFDLLHNKIIADTITEQFSESVRTVLLPKIEAKYADTLVGIQMYEDYIADKLTAGGAWYYPLTVITREGCSTEWVRWQMNKKDFRDGIPYSYTGKEPLSIELCEAPCGFADKISGRARCFEGGCVKLTIEAAASSPTFLSGKYSQSFVDEMARQLTAKISESAGISGLAESTLELVLVFAPESYMEHTSENVTYRRLLITDRSSAPRDLWIKWTRKNSTSAYSVSDTVTSGGIVFELGEDVPQKIREKEYRFLLRAGKDKYHNSMGRKNITEWRELIKRAIRRGELEKLAPVFVPVDKDEEIKSELSRILGGELPRTVTLDEPIVNEAAEDELLSLARAAVMADAKDKDEDVIVSFEDEDEAEEEAEDEPDELEKYYAEADEVSEGAVAETPEEAEELDEITRLAMMALRENETQSEPSANPKLEDIDPTAEYEQIEIADADEDEEIEDEEIFEAEPDGDELADIAALEPDDEPLVSEISEEPLAEAPATRAEIEANIRAEIEAQVRLEYERRERERAEEEAARLRREQEQLRLENERLQERARREREEWERREEERRAEEARLRAQIEQQLKAEAKERERLAEAARLAVEEQKRLEEERARAELMRLEEEKRLAREAEEKRLEEERAKEAERIRREAEERAAKELASEAENTKYTYTSKLVKLLFRKSVDPNITSRIYEIIKATIEYYGKEKVYLRIKASVPDTSTVHLEFVKIPMEEMELLSNIIKVLGNSGLGIAKAIVE